MKSISRVLIKLCKKDHVFRFGGDEFILVFKNEFDENKILKLAQQIISEVANIKVDQKKAISVLVWELQMEFKII